MRKIWIWPQAESVVWCCSVGFVCWEVDDGAHHLWNRFDSMAGTGSTRDSIALEEVIRNTQREREHSVSLQNAIGFGGVMFFRT